MMVKARVNPLVKEMLLGHRVGLENNYYRPSFEEDIVPEYLKAIDLLTLDDSNRLRKRIEEMTLKCNDSELLLRGRLQEEITHLKMIHSNEMKKMRQEMESKFTQIISMVRLMTITGTRAVLKRFVCYANMLAFILN